MSIQDSERPFCTLFDSNARLFRGYNVRRRAFIHPLVYSSTPHPQWSSGYDFRLSLTPTSRGRPGFDSLLRSISGSDSSSISPSSGAG
jgi:hypothetical protein